MTALWKLFIVLVAALGLLAALAGGVSPKSRLRES